MTLSGVLLHTTARFNRTDRHATERNASSTPELESRARNPRNFETAKIHITATHHTLSNTGYVKPAFHTSSWAVQRKPLARRRAAGLRASSSPPKPRENQPLPRAASKCRATAHSWARLTRTRAPRRGLKRLSLWRLLPRSASPSSSCGRTSKCKQPVLPRLSARMTSSA